jgi:hypothetical protein
LLPYYSNFSCSLLCFCWGYPEFIHYNEYIDLQWRTLAANINAGRSSEVLPQIPLLIGWEGHVLLASSCSVHVWTHGKINTPVYTHYSFSPILPPIGLWTLTVMRAYALYACRLESQAPCYCIKHSSSHLTFCIKMPHVSYTLKQVFMYDIHMNNKEKTPAFISGCYSSI